MEERTIKLDLATAKKWYKGNDKSLKELALQVYMKDELEGQLPTNWAEVFNTVGIYVDCKDKYYNNICLLYKLIKVRDIYRQGWEPEYNSLLDVKYAITFSKYKFNKYKLQISTTCLNPYIFSFQSEELAELFLDSFKGDLEKLKDLL